MKLYNSLIKKIEDFKPNSEGKVGIYSCGPTVYWNQHIGHMYAYVQWDILVRYLRYLGNDVNWVMNITDVGHMTSDEDTGEDKMEKGAKREGVSVWDLADRYIGQFQESLNILNITTPNTLSRATKHIDEQISLAKLIEKNGFAYKTEKGLVFDTSKFADYSKFADLKLTDQKKREDVEDDPEKKNPWDFFLWVTGNTNHIMQWESPWGKGYPGWHLECTAMSTKYLGNNFDIHTGGIEHIPVHHTDEIAQGFAAYGKRTANYWLHNAWLKADKGVKMSKSLGNFVTVQDLVKDGHDPLALRYLFLSSHYRKGMNFSVDALKSAQTGLDNLRRQVSSVKKQGRNTLSSEKSKTMDSLRERFFGALDNDLNMPMALSIAWEALKSNIPSSDKYDLLIAFDEVMGLGLSSVAADIKVPERVLELMEEREKFRKKNNYDRADVVRKEIESLGFGIDDSSVGSVLVPISDMRDTS